MLSDLPDELLYDICERLNIRQVLEMSQTASQYRNVCIDIMERKINEELALINKEYIFVKYQKSDHDQILVETRYGSDDLLEVTESKHVEFPKSIFNDITVPTAIRSKWIFFGDRNIIQDPYRPEESRVILDTSTTVPRIDTWIFIEFQRSD